MATKGTVGARLAEYIGVGADKKMSVRAFAAAMARRTPRPKGSTRAMVNRYRKGTTTPRSDFIAAAAATLGLNAEWLASGTGPETPGSELVAAIANLTQETAGEWRRTALRIRRAVLGTAGENEDIPYWVAPLADLWMSGDLIPYRGNAPADLAALGAALRAPLEALGLSPEKIGVRAFRDYALGMVPVLFTLGAHQARRRKADSDGRADEDRIRRIAEDVGRSQRRGEDEEGIRRLAEEQRIRRRTLPKPKTRAPQKRGKVSKPAAKAKR